MRAPEKDFPEQEENYILGMLKSLVYSAGKIVPIFLVGDWPRSTILKYQAFHFETLCFSSDFDLLKEKLRISLLSISEEAPFYKPANLKSIPSDDINSPMRCIFRLTSRSQKKYKISIENIFQDDLYRDMRMRDFTLNSLYYNVEKGCFIQDSNVNFDFDNRILRTNKPPNETFCDQINLYFRLFEYQARYDLMVDKKIFDHFKTIDAAKILKVAVQTQRNNFKSSSNKFFSKNYVWQMLRAMADLNALSFFKLNYNASTSFILVWRICIEILYEVEQIFTDGPDSVLMNKYPNGLSQVFYSKTRLFAIVLVFYLVDPEYALKFMSIFIYNGKELSPDCEVLLNSMCGLLMFTPGSSVPEKLAQTKDFVNPANFDSSKWGFYVVAQAVFNAHPNGLGFLPH